MPLRTINTGVTALARELGITAASVSARLKKGQNPDFIRRAVQTRKQLGKQNPGRKLGPVRPSVMMSGKGDEVVVVREVPKPGQSPKSYSPKHKVVVGKPAPKQADRVPNRLPSVPFKQNGRDARSNGHTPSADGLTTADHVYLENRQAAELRKIIAQANEREVKVAQLRGALVPVAQMNFWFGGCIRRHVDRVFRIPGEYKDRLAVCDDPVECERMLREELEAAFRELREMPVEGTGTGMETQEVEGPDEE